MKIDDQMIGKISRLARLEFETHERERIRQDLEQILTFVEKLNELDTDDVEPLIYLSDKTDVLRADRVEISISHEEALMNAPEKSGPFFRVPKVIRKGSRS
jgi:aspartyl-tRNA(Asn)/glutamyl-tRNA(Gln) amidotransferase subunit C